MNTIKSIESKTTITLDYEDFNNTLEIHIGNSSGFRFVNLDLDKCNQLIEIINEIKEQIHE